MGNMGNIVKVGHGMSACDGRITYCAKRAVISFMILKTNGLMGTRDTPLAYTLRVFVLIHTYLNAFGAYDLKVKSAVVWPGVSIVPELHARQWSGPGQTLRAGGRVYMYVLVRVPRLGQ
jgi:hypothetical protein